VSSVARSYFDVVEGAAVCHLQVEGGEGVVDGVPHRGLDGPAALGAHRVVVGEVERLDDAAMPGDQHALAVCRRGDGKTPALTQEYSG